MLFEGKPVILTTREPLKVTMLLGVVAVQQVYQELRSLNLSSCIYHQVLALRLYIYIL